MRRKEILLLTFISSTGMLFSEKFLFLIVISMPATYKSHPIIKSNKVLFHKQLMIPTSDYKIERLLTHEHRRCCYTFMCISRLWYSVSEA